MKRTLMLCLSIAALLVMCFAGTGCFEKTGIVSGTVIDATTGAPLAGVRVSSGRAVQTTGTNGLYSLQLPVGVRTITFHLTGYFDYAFNVNVEENVTVTVDAPTPISPNLTEGEYRIVLTWNELPEDIDSHLWTPGGYEVYFADEGSYESSPYAALDVDDVTSYGPETITITQMSEGTYTYSVHNYSEDADLAGCGATVRVYDHTGLIKTYTMPGAGTGIWWNVFTLNGTTITDVNTITTTPPLPSAVDDVVVLSRAKKH